MWKGFLDKGKCLLGFHDGPWQYRRPGDCAQAMTCGRCGIESQRIEHTWAEWVYRADHACDLVRTCSRCGQKEQRVAHVWSEPEYAKARACEQVAVCTRCRAHEPRGVSHVFSRWEYGDAETCTQIHACARCGVHGTDTRVHHEWSAWTNSEYYGARVRVCGHCGDMTVAVPGVNADATPSMQAVGAAVDGLLSAKGWDDVRARLTRDCGTLLSPVADQYCRFALDHYALNDDARQALLGAQHLVGLSREQGVEAALQAVGAVTVRPVPERATVQGPVEAAAPRSPTTAGSLDERLVGHWRTTEHLGGGGVSMVTDTHCVLDRYGDCAWWSQSAGPMGSSESDRDMGKWGAINERLVLRFGSGESLTRDYLVQGGQMVWPGDGRYKYWERVDW